METTGITQDTPNRRLTSWKEISAYLRRSVRTCQRWEKEFNLPIHRFGKAGQGEILYALVEELEAWQHSTEAQVAYQQRSSLPNRARLPINHPTTLHIPPATTQPRSAGLRWSRVAVAAFVLVAGAGLVFGWTKMSRRPPASVRISGRKIVAVDIHGADIWEYSFSSPIADCAVVPPKAPSKTPYGSIDYSLEACPDRVVTEDIDGDGLNEVIVARQKGELYCLTADGKLRSTYSMSHPVEYYETLDNQKPMPDPGVKKYNPPFSLNHLVLMKNRAGHLSVWVAGHHPEWYPSFLQEIDLRNETPKVVSDYWSPGFISVVERGQVGGHDMILVGAAHNETGGSSLAVFIDSPVRGTPPTLGGDKKCMNCPAGGPDQFFVFPRSLALSSMSVVSLVHYISGLGQAGFTVEVCSVLDPQVRAIVDCPAVDYYGFDGNLKIVSANVGSYMKYQRRLEELHFLPPSTRNWSNADLFPVYWWRGNHLEKLTAPTPAH